MSTLRTATKLGREYRLVEVKGHPFYFWKDGPVTDENDNPVKGERLENLRKLIAQSLDQDGSQHGSRSQDPPARTPRSRPDASHVMRSLSAQPEYADTQESAAYTLFPRGDVAPRPTDPGGRSSRGDVRSEAGAEQRPALSRDRHGKSGDAAASSSSQPVVHRSKDSGKWQTDERDFAAADSDPRAEPRASGSRHQREVRESLEATTAAFDHLALTGRGQPLEGRPGSVRVSPAPVQGPESTRPPRTSTALQSVPEATQVNYRGTEDTLDSRYNVRHSKWFSVGRVLAVLWHENDSRAAQRSDLSDPTPFLGKFGERVYSTIRRFIVVKTGDGYCTCIPIVTYRKQGVMKHGLPPNEIKKHSVVHMIGTESDAKPAEVDRGMSKRPIAVNPASDDQGIQKLHPMSRLNFGKVCNIDHQWKVMSVGKVHTDYLPRLESYFYDTLNDRPRHR